MRLQVLFSASVMTFGCRAWSFDAAMGDGGTSTSTSSTTVATAGPTDGGANSTSDGAATSSSDDGDPTAPDTGSAIIDEPDMGGWACDVWAQDCTTGFKCMACNDDGSSSWNSSCCTPIADEPKRPGEPCTVVGSGVSGVDDCELGAMCWDVDPVTLMGRCVAQCLGVEANPICADPCLSCSIYADGWLQLCHADCDPLIQDCSRGEACVPTGDSFVCAPDVSGDEGVIGDPCAFPNVCDPSLFCANQDAVPNCDSTGCCAPFCDLSVPDECAALLPGTSCVPWYPEGLSPEACLLGRGVVGACVIPD